MDAMSPDAVILAQVLCAYSRRGLRVLSLLEASVRNENYLAVDADGMQCVLRRCRRNPDARGVDFQVRFQQHLHRGGYPTALVIETDAGDPIMRASGSLWVLFAHVQGVEYDFGRGAQAAEAGRRLAQFHLVAEMFPGDDVPMEFDPPVRKWWEDWEADLRALKALFAGLPLQDELFYLADWWRRFANQWPPARLNALPAG